MRDIIEGLLLVSTVWLLLGAQPVLAESVEPESATFVVFVGCAAITLLGWRPGVEDRGLAGARRVLLGLVAGIALHPVWLLAIRAAGVGLGFDAPPKPSAGLGPALGLSVFVVAPVFEEVLYRDRLLTALRTRCVDAMSVWISSALFAIPHVDDWSVLGAFLSGCALGTIRIRTRSTALCIGLHAGLNLAHGIG